MYRPAYLAGQWYPGTERECAAAIDAHAADTSPKQGAWRALISPHAGWTYSGDAAGRGFRWLAEAQPNADLVVLFGAHRGPEGPNTIFRACGWDTPLGLVSNAQDIADQLALELRLRDEPATPLRPDNAVEVQVPFVRRLFGDAEILMMGLGASKQAVSIGEHVGRLLREAGRNAVFVGSTDLTHYGPNYLYEPVGRGKQAVEWVRCTNDQAFIDRVLAYDVGGAIAHAVDNQSACCPGSVGACMAAATAYGRGDATALVEHYLSYDILNNPSFVGYASIVL